MKKIYLLALLCLPFIQLKAQDGIVFKIKYLPEHNYQVALKMGMKITANITGDPQIIDKLSSSGLTSPVNANLEVALGGATKTGSMDANKSFPMSMEYKISELSVSANGKDVPIPPKISDTTFRMHAHVTSDGQIVFDDLMGKKVSDTMQKKMSQMMSMVQKQIKFPEKALKVGDTFTEGSPMNLPVGKGGNQVKVNASVTYKLTSISDGKAYFDLTPQFDMNVNFMGASINFSGTGSGKMVYDIKNNFPLSKDASINVKIKVLISKNNTDGTTTKQLDVDGTAVITSNYTTTIN